MQDDFCPFSPLSLSFDTPSSNRCRHAYVSLAMDLARGLVAISLEAAGKTAGTFLALTTDTGSTLGMIASESASTVVKVAGDASSTGMKIARDSVNTCSKVVSDSLGTAGKIASDCGETARQVFRGNVSGVPEKLLRDSLETGAKIVTDSAGTVAKITTDTAGTGSKVLSDVAGSASKIKDAALSTSEKIAQDTQNLACKVSDDTLTTTVHAANHVLSSLAANTLLKYATDVYSTAGDVEVVDAILQIASRSVKAMGRSLGGAALIWKAIFTNHTNEDHLRFIMDHLYDLFRFLYDVVRPGTVISEPQSMNDAAVGSRPEWYPATVNPFNELDLRHAANRYAVIHQVQRFALTLVKILKLAREQIPPSGLHAIPISFSLQNEDENPPPPTYISKLERGLQSPERETWLFVNGIANEYVWFQRSCDKIRDTFKRDVKGIYNRTDGILWDLIETFGEHSSVRTNELLERTQSSKAAQRLLERELRDAVWPADGRDPGKVVMIAHSQGCLVLRLALQTLVVENPGGSQRRMEMKQRLRIFTFANPGIDWRVMDGAEHSLSEYASLTEHFTHEADFVAVLGIVTHWADRGSGYDEDSIFFSKEGRGHLFGAHYPLRAEAYENGNNSELLKAVKGNKIA